MSAAHTPTRHYWNTGAEPSKYVFVGGAKPINAGSIERAQQICRACNAHDDNVRRIAELEAALEAIRDSAVNALVLGGTGPGFFSDVRDDCNAALVKGRF